METPAQPPIHGTLRKNARRGTACAASNLHKNGVIGRQFAPVNRRTARLAQRLIYTITALSGGGLRSWTGARRDTAGAMPNPHNNGAVRRQFAPRGPARSATAISAKNAIDMRGGAHYIVIRGRWGGGAHGLGRASGQWRGPGQIVSKGSARACPNQSLRRSGT